MRKIVATIGTQNYKMEIKTDTNTLISDEPIDKGGQDLGFSPSQLLAGSLASCTAATIQMYAQRKEWLVESICVTVHYDLNTEDGNSYFEKEIQICGTLSEEQLKRLHIVADKCPIHKAITNPIHITSKIK
jgi:putative redox protein